MTFVPCGRKGFVLPDFTCSHSWSPFQWPYLPQSRHFPVFLPAAFVPEGPVPDEDDLPLPLPLGFFHPLDLDLIFFPARMN